MPVLFQNLSYKKSSVLPTTSRIGNLTRLIHALAICVTLHTYVLHTLLYVLIHLQLMCLVANNKGLDVLRFFFEDDGVALITSLAYS